MTRKKDAFAHGEVLVAILKSVSDFTIIQEQGWYRVPVRIAPKKWPPRWLAFYQPKAFGNDAYQIRYWGEVSEISQALGKDLFPEKPYGEKAEKAYHKLKIRKLNELELPIPSLKPHRLVFIPTTKIKFDRAEQINDLFHDSPIEVRLWGKFKILNFPAERQWFMPIDEKRYFLDFALFCNQGFIDIETDGDQHKERPQLEIDQQRNNALASKGWRVLRYDSKQINEELESYCIPQINNTIDKLGGLSEEGLVSRKFYNKGGKTIQQLTLFEKGELYKIDPAFDSGASENLEVLE